MRKINKVTICMMVFMSILVIQQTAVFADGYFTVQTGDNTNMDTWIVLLAVAGIALVGLGALTLYKRKKNK